MKIDFFLSLWLSESNILLNESLIHHIFVAQCYYLLKVSTPGFYQLKGKKADIIDVYVFVRSVKYTQFIYLTVPSRGFCSISGVCFFYIINAYFFYFILLKWFICRTPFICYICIWHVKHFLFSFKHLYNLGALYSEYFIDFFGWYISTIQWIVHEIRKDIPELFYRTCIVLTVAQLDAVE